MKTITISISEREFEEFGFQSDSLSFKDFLDKINREIAKKALLSCHKIAKETGLSELTMDEINSEIKAVREIAKNRS